ncbi:MAG TPA: type III secretion system gatekeeper subunit SctW [Dyella sp.]|uniref:type III secretion system gatekeeper subunit SctW n=1 Tax=Dyella sp. TaxID=1869338 RepID=UPI002F93D003
MSKSTQASALEMADDLSALKSTLRKRREGEGESETVSSQAWVDRVLEENAEDHYANLKSAMIGGTAALQAFRLLLSQLFPDPSDVAAVLRALLLDEELTDEWRVELERLLADLLDGPDGRSARAGLNAAIKAKLGARRQSFSAKQLRSAYRSFLDQELPPSSLYELWIEQYGFEQRLGVIDFIDSALAADMYALDPSCSRIEFGQMLQRSRNLASLRSVDNTILQTCWIEPVMGRLGIHKADLIVTVLNLIRDGGGLPRLLKTAWAPGQYIWSVTEKIALSQALGRAVRLVPHDLWCEAVYQQQALDEIETWSGHEIRRESLLSPLCATARIL